MDNINIVSKKKKRSITIRIINFIVISIIVFVTLCILTLCVISLTYNFGIMSNAESVECDIGEEVDVDYLDKEEHNGITIYSYEGTKSDNPEDYRYISFDVRVKSFCIQDQVRVDAVLSEIKYFEENILYSYEHTLDMNHFINSGDSITLPVRLYVYVGDMTEEDIEKLIDGVVIDVVVGGEVRKSVKFSKCDNIIY